MQTPEGRKKALATILKNNPDHFKEIGKKGGEKGVGHTFGHGKVDPKLAVKRRWEIARAKKEKNL